MRKAFKMKLYEGKIKEYEKRHNELWDEMKELIHTYGGKEYSIFFDEETHYLFAVIDLGDEKKWSKLAETEINKKWWDFMADIMETNKDNSPVCKDLTEVFYLE